MRKIIKAKINDSIKKLKDTPIKFKKIRKYLLMSAIAATAASTSIGLHSCSNKQDEKTIEFYNVENDSDEITIETIDGKKIKLNSGLFAQEIENRREPRGKTHVRVFNEEEGKFIEGYVNKRDLSLVKRFPIETFENYDTIYTIGNDIEIEGKTLKAGEMIIGSSKLDVDSDVMKGFYINKRKGFEVEIPIENIKEWRNKSAIVTVKKYDIEHLRMRKSPSTNSEVFKS